MIIQRPPGRGRDFFNIQRKLPWGVDQFFGKSHPPGPLHLGTMPYTLRGTGWRRPSGKGEKTSGLGTSGSGIAATCPHFLLLPSPILGLHWVLVQVEGPGVGKFHRKIEPHPSPGPPYQVLGRTESIHPSPAPAPGPDTPSAGTQVRGSRYKAIFRRHAVEKWL